MDRKILSAAFLSVLFFVTACENDEKDIKDMTEKKIMVEEAKDVTTFFSQQGILKAKLRAPLMFRYFADTLYIDFPNTLHVDFYDPNKKIESYLDARRGKYFENLNKVLLRDSVVFINVKGDTLKTSELWWDQQLKLFFTDSVVSIHQKDKQILGGRGFEADQDFTRRVIKYPTGVISIPKSDSSMVKDSTNIEQLNKE